MEGTPQSQSTPQRRIRSRPVGGVRFALLAVPALAAGPGLLLWVLKPLFVVNGDALVYGGLAKTLLHGHYELNWAGGPPVPTLIRLPGYPIFLALSFKLFGMEN